MLTRRGREVIGNVDDEVVVRRRRRRVRIVFQKRLVGKVNLVERGKAGFHHARALVESHELQVVQGSIDVGVVDKVSGERDGAIEVVYGVWGAAGNEEDLSGA